jgi:hypothetical protein
MTRVELSEKMLGIKRSKGCSRKRVGATGNAQTEGYHEE